MGRSNSNGNDGADDGQLGEDDFDDVNENGSQSTRRIFRNFTVMASVRANANANGTLLGRKKSNSNENMRELIPLGKVTTI